MIKGYLNGVREMKERLRHIKEKFPDRVAAALYQEMHVVLNLSNTYCPVASDGGELRASGKVNEPERKGRVIKCTMTYGGGAIQYALAVHEHLSDHSPPSWVKAEESGRGIRWSEPGTGPKFAERAINESSPHMLERIAKRIHFQGAGA